MHFVGVSFFSLSLFLPYLYPEFFSSHYFFLLKVISSTLVQGWTCCLKERTSICFNLFVKANICWEKTKQIFLWFFFLFFLVSLPFTMFCLSRFYWLPFIRNFMIALYSLIKSSMATFSNLLMPVFFILSLSLSMPTKILKGYIFLIFPLHAVFVLFVCTLI